ncbi:MAG: tetratricopeptide repeat protein [Nitrospirota bacterium]
MKKQLFLLSILLLLLITQSQLWGSGSDSTYDEGVSLFRAGKYREAVEKLTQALPTDADKAKVYVVLGKSLFNLQRYDESKVAFESALNINSASMTAKLGILMIEAASGKCENVLPAIENMEPAKIEIDERKTLYRLQVKCDKSDKYKTIERLTSLINLETGRVDLNEYLYLWQLYTETNQTKRALNAIESVIQISDTPENRENYAISLFNDGQIEQSILEYKELIKKNPQVAVYHLRLANALTAKEQYNEAKNEITAALSLEPKNAGLYYAKSIIELIEKKYDQCIQSGQTAIDIGKDEIRPGALLIVGDCYYEEGNVAEAIKKYDTLYSEYPKSDKAVFAKRISDNIRQKSAGEAYQIDKVPFLKKGAYSSLSTALNMVLKYWSKRYALSEKEVAAIEFDDRMPSIADAWILLKGKGLGSFVTEFDISLIKALVTNQIPVIMRGNPSSNYRVITGFDERRKTLYYYDPTFINRLGQVIYNAETLPSDTIIVVMPLKLIDKLVEREVKRSQEVISGRLASTEISAMAELINEKDGDRVAERIYQFYPKMCESKLLLAEILFSKNDIKKSIIYYSELLSMKSCSSFARGLAYLKMAVSYNKLGDKAKADQYLTQAKKIDSAAEESYKRLLENKTNEYH